MPVPSQMGAGARPPCQTLVRHAHARPLVATRVLTSWFPPPPSPRRACSDSQLCSGGADGAGHAAAASEQAPPAGSASGDTGDDADLAFALALSMEADGGDQTQQQAGPPGGEEGASAGMGSFLRGLSNSLFASRRDATTPRARSHPLPCVATPAAPCFSATKWSFSCGTTSEWGGAKLPRSAATVTPHAALRGEAPPARGPHPAPPPAAVLALYRRVSREQPGRLQAWEGYGEAKVVLRVPDLAALYAPSTPPPLFAVARALRSPPLRVRRGAWSRQRYEAAARAAGLPTAGVMDAGRTQVAPGSHTAVAIGPGSVSEVDQITGSLRLL